MVEEEFEVRLGRWASEQPDRNVRLILTIDVPPSEAVDKLREKGLTVRREFRLLKAVAVEGEARKVWALRNERWIVKLEEDREVRGI